MKPSFGKRYAHALTFATETHLSAEEFERARLVQRAELWCEEVCEGATKAVPVQAKPAYAGFLYQSGFQATQFVSETLTLRRHIRSVSVLADECAT